MNDKCTREETKQLLEHAVSHFGLAKKVADYLEVEPPRISEGREGKWCLPKNLAGKIISECGVPSAKPGKYLSAIGLKAIDDLIPSAEGYLKSLALKNLNDQIDRFEYDILSMFKKYNTYNDEQRLLDIKKIKAIILSDKLKAWSCKTKAYFSGYSSRISDREIFKCFSDEMEIKKDCEVNGIDYPKTSIEQTFREEGFDVTEVSSYLLLLLVEIYSSLHKTNHEKAENKEYILTGGSIFKLNGELKKIKRVYFSEEVIDNRISASLTNEVFFDQSAEKNHFLGDFRPEELKYSFNEERYMLMKDYCTIKNFSFLKTYGFIRIEVDIHLKSDLNYTAHIRLYHEELIQHRVERIPVSFLVDSIKARDIFIFIKKINTLLGKESKDHDLTSLKEKIANAGGYIPGVKVL